MILLKYLCSEHKPKCARWNNVEIHFFFQTDYNNTVIINIIDFFVSIDWESLVECIFFVTFEKIG